MFVVYCFLIGFVSLKMIHYRNTNRVLFALSNDKFFFVLSVRYFGLLFLLLFENDLIHLNTRRRFQFICHLDWSLIGDRIQNLFKLFLFYFFFFLISLNIAMQHFIC